jgi:hypothetical protein
LIEGKVELLPKPAKAYFLNAEGVLADEGGCEEAETKTT